MLLETDPRRAFLRSALMVRAIALRYAMRMRTLHRTMQRVYLLASRQTRTNTWQGFRTSNGAVGMARCCKEMVKLVKEAGEAAEEIINDSSNAGTRQCAPSSTTPA